MGEAWPCGHMYMANRLTPQGPCHVAPARVVDHFTITPWCGGSMRQRLAEPMRSARLE